MKYEVLCGNIGMVHQGDDLTEARRVYEEYVAQSKSRRGRAAGEDVTLLEDGEPIATHTGELEEVEQEALAAKDLNTIADKLGQILERNKGSMGDTDVHNMRGQLRKLREVADHLAGE